MQGDWKLDFRFRAGMRFSATTCTLLDQHRNLFGCDVRSEVLTAAEADAVLAFASQVIDLKPGIICSGEEKAAAKTRRHEMKAFLIENEASVWDPGLPLMLCMAHPGALFSSSEHCLRDCSLCAT